MASQIPQFLKAQKSFHYLCWLLNKRPNVASIDLPSAMASFEDYDEFGNYIGADLDSGEEDEEPQNALQQAPEAQPLEGYDEPMDSEQEGALMQIDGASRLLPSYLTRPQP